MNKDNRFKLGKCTTLEKMIGLSIEDPRWKSVEHRLYTSRFMFYIMTKVDKYVSLINLSAL